MKRTSFVPSCLRVSYRNACFAWCLAAVALLVAIAPSAAFSAPDPTPKWRGWLARSPAGTPEIRSESVPELESSPLSAMQTFATMPVPMSPGEFVPLLPVDLNLPLDPVLAETARALDHDWRKLYLHVRNQVRFVPYGGFARGAARTLLDREGNSGDQALLLATLLRLSGYAATIVYSCPGMGGNDEGGGLYVPLAGSADGYDAASWLGTDATVDAVWGALWSTGLTASFWDGGEYLAVEHYWVYCEAEGDGWFLDPSFKPQPTQAPRNVAADMDYDRTAFLAALGGVADTNQVVGLSSSAVATEMTRLSAELAETWHLALPTALAADILGRTVVSPQSLDEDTSYFHGSYLSEFVANLLAQPPSEQAYHRCPVTIATEGFERGLWLDEVAERTLWLGYTNTPGYTFPAAVLHVDDLDIALEPAGSQSSLHGVSVEVNRPRAQIAPAAYVLGRNTGAAHVLVLGFGSDEPALWRARLSDRRTLATAASTAARSRAAMLHAIGDAYEAHSRLADRLSYRLAGCRRTPLHNIGFVGDYPAPWVDFKNSADGLPEVPMHPDAGSLLGSALEHAIIEDHSPSNHTAVSTVRLLALASAAGEPLYLATAANYPSIVCPSLTNYPPFVLDEFQDYLDDGMSLLIHRDGTQSVGDWQGLGYMAFGGSDTDFQCAMMISGGLAGGQGTRVGPYAEEIVRQRHALESSHDASRPRITAADPVDLQTGAFLSRVTDLALAGPSPLTATRRYDSRLRVVDGPFGRGWSSDLDLRVSRHAAADALLGRRGATEAAASVAACIVVDDLLSVTNSPRHSVAAVLVAHWWAEQYVRGAATISGGGESLTFLRAPDGNTYLAPPGVTAALTETDGLFTLTERLGPSWSFNAAGRLAVSEDRSGNATTFHYDTATNLVAVSNTFGRALLLSWSGGRVAAVRDGTGRTVAYAYDDTGCLTNAIDAAGFAWAAAYDASGAILSKTDPEGNRIILNAYNALGQVTGQVSSAGQPWSFGYAAGAHAWDEDPAGRRNTRDFTAAGRVAAYTRRDGTKDEYSYDTHGHLVTNLDPIGRTHIFGYDSHDTLVRTTQAANTTNARATAFAYDNRHRLVAVSNALGLVTTFAYDDKDRVTLTTFADGTSAANTWNAFGLRSSETLLDSIDQPLRHTDFTYDANGRPASQSMYGHGMPCLAETATEFDAIGNLVRLTDANGRETHFHYDARGLLTNTVDAAGYSAVTAYDGRGLPASVTDPLGRTTAFRWTASGDLAAVLLPDGASVTNVYDAVDRLAAVTDPRGTRVDFERDAVGRVTRRHTASWQDRTWYDIVGCVTSVLDAASVWTDFGYDWLDRPVLATDGLGREWTTAFDALDRVSGTTDPRGRTRQYAYDPLGRRTAVVRPSGATDSFAYNGLGNWTTYTNAEGHVYTMTYDAQSRPLAATNALGQQVFCNFYDPAGNLTYRFDGAGNVTTYSYDVLNRLISRQGSAGVPPASFSHDAVGSLLTASNAIAQEAFTYDVMDRFSSAMTVVSNTTFTTTYARDLGGLVTNVVFGRAGAPNPPSITRAYDPDGRLVSASDWLGHTWTFSHDGVGKPTGGTAPGGILSTNQYDAAGRLASWSVGTLAGRTITRDAAGLKVRDDITAGPLPAPHNVRYAENTFDAADRLTSATVRYGSHTNAAVPETYLYDGNGALTNLVSGTDAVFSAAYDPLGQLSSLQGGAGVPPAVFGYDALGNRLVSGDRLWIPDHADPLKRPLIEADAATGAPIRYYLWAPGRLLGFIDAASGVLTVAHCDEYGSVVALTDASGTVLHTAVYGPNGQDWGTTGTNHTSFAWLSGHGVQKVASSDHLGPLYLTRYRLYAASLNRFVSPDPLGLAGGLNLYAYAEGDPLSYIDPLGLCAEGSGFWQDFWTRLGGLGQMIGGVAEAAAGYTFGVATSPTIAGGLLGAAVGTHGIDNAQAGVRQWWTGQPVDAMSSGLLQWAGLSRQTAKTVNSVISVVATLGTSVANMAATAKTAASTADDIAVQFGNNANQTHHAFRHTDALGLDRALVQSGVQNISKLWHRRLLQESRSIKSSSSTVNEFNTQRFVY